MYKTFKISVPSPVKNVPHLSTSTYLYILADLAPPWEIAASERFYSCFINIGGVSSSITESHNSAWRRKTGVTNFHNSRGHWNSLFISGVCFSSWLTNVKKLWSKGYFVLFILLPLLQTVLHEVSIKIDVIIDVYKNTYTKQIKKSNFHVFPTHRCSVFNGALILTRSIQDEWV